MHELTGLGPGNDLPAFSSLYALVPNTLKPNNVKTRAAANCDSGSVTMAVRSGLNEAIAAGQVIAPPIRNLAKASLPEFGDLELLRKFLGDPNAEFKSVAQAVALSTILRGALSALIILPTGSGKSIIWYFGLQGQKWYNPGLSVRRLRLYVGCAWLRLTSCSKRSC